MLQGWGKRRRDVRGLGTLGTLGTLRGRLLEIPSRRLDVHEPGRHVRVLVQGLPLQRGGDNHRLPPAQDALADVVHDPRHVPAEVARQEVIRLVHHEALDAVRAEDAASAQLRDAPRGTDDDERPLATKLFLLPPDVSAADALLGDVFAKLPEHPFHLSYDLHAELLRRDHHKALDAVRSFPARLLLVQDDAVEHGEEVGHGLAAARVGLHGDVGALVEHGDGGELRWRGMFETRGVERGAEVLAQTEVGEGLGGGIARCRIVRRRRRGGFAGVGRLGRARGRVLGLRGIGRACDGGVDPSRGESAAGIHRGRAVRAERHPPLRRPVRRRRVDASLRRANGREGPAGAREEHRGVPHERCRRHGCSSRSGDGRVRPSNSWLRSEVERNE